MIWGKVDDIVTEYDVIVIGGGQSGLATGYYLNQTGLTYVILEAQAAIGGSWQNYWHSLRLFSPARYSELPGMEYPTDPDHYPTRAEVINYLRTYADKFSLPVMTNTRVECIANSTEGFTVHTNDGRVLESRLLVDATGAFNRPYIPQIAGFETYQGEWLHTYRYREPQPFVDKRIIVIGANNSAVQVGVDLAEVADVTLAIRRPIRWTPTRVLGKNIFFWFHATGFDMLPLGRFFNLSDIDNVYDDGTLQAYFDAGNPDTREMFTQFTENGVIWPDGEHEKVDTVVFATGFRSDNKPYLAELGALDEDGNPQQNMGVSTSVEGLYYVGVFGQRSAASATLRGVGADAKYVVEQIEKQVGSRKQHLAL